MSPKKVLLATIKAPITGLARLLNARLEWRFLAAAIVIVLSDIYGMLFPFFTENAYALGAGGNLLPENSAVMANYVKYDSSQQAYNFDIPTQSTSNLMGQPIYSSATLNQDAKKGITVSDTVNKVDLTMTPKFQLLDGRRDGDRIIYPLADGNGWVVYTLRGDGVKENLVLNYATGDKMSFNYTLNLGNTLTAKVETDGSLGIYGNTVFSGNISTGSDKDAQLLEKARQNAPKNTLLFKVPAPSIVDKNGPVNDIKAKYSLSGDMLTVTTTGMNKGHYPIAIDPSLYVVTAVQFMQGNNETNVNFDVDNKLIKKGTTTGARFDTWNSATGLPTGVWGAGTVPAGGYIYQVGGTTFQKQIFSSQGAGTFTVPSGVTSVTIKAWGGGGGGGAGGGSSGVSGGAGGGGGYTTGTFNVNSGDTLNVYVGGAGGAGIRSTVGAGGGGGGYSSVYDLTNSNQLLALAAGGGGGGGARATNAGAQGGPGGGVTGTAGTAATVTGGGGGTSSSGGSGGTGGTTAGAAGSSLTGGLGGDGRGSGSSTGGANNGGLATGGDGGSIANGTQHSGGGGGGSGYFGGGGGSASLTNSGASGGGGGSSYTDPGGTGVSNTAGSTTSPGNSGDSDRSGAGNGGAGGTNTANGTGGSNGIVVITWGSGGTTNTTAVNWAQFDTSTNALDSPNPGTGACSGWCTNSVYNLPDGRANLSLVAYNGFLYAIGGTSANCTAGNGTGTSGYCKTVYIARLGANGEPRLWHPTDPNPNNWVYWYRDTDLAAQTAYSGAIAYKNHMYLVGGLTGSATAVSTVRTASITGAGTLSGWTTSTAYGSNIYGHSIQVYNSRLYVIGGASSVGGAPTANVYYNKINTDGSLNSWVQATSMVSGRMTMGGNISVIWGAYIYVSGGCGTVNASGYCTSVLSDTQVASINADGSLDTWSTVGGVSDTRMSQNLIAWRNTLYEIGGCSAMNTSTGDCNSNILSTVNYGTINSDGDASTVGTSVASGTAPCSGGSPESCNLPASIGNVLNETVLTNGYLYIMGGCTNNGCTSESTAITYQAVGSDGSLTKPATCAGSYTDSYCVSTITLPTGLAAAGTAVFQGHMYLVGGFGTGTNVYYANTNSDGSLGSWSSADLSTIGAPNTLSYSYVYARANPASASSVPGNLYIIGGCLQATVGCSSYSATVDKCNLSTTGVPSSCSTTNQVQLQDVNDGGDCGTGLGAMIGTVYANYIYLMGGLTPNCTDLVTTRYAKFDNNNNIVTVGSGWVEGANQMATGRRRGSGFGYNGYLYAVGGYDGTSGVLADIEFAKLNTSDGSWGSWNVSAVTINQRWGLSVPISNSYAYVIGGCTAGAAPSSCTTRTPTIQTFQVYNNDSGAPAGYTTSANTYGTSPNRIGVAGAVLNGYIYAAGGCTGTTTDCTSAVNTVSYASLDSYGNVGTWTNTTASLTAARAWGKLLASGGTLYYIGGQDTDGNAQSTVYYGTPSSGNVSTWSTATNGLPASLTRFGATVWNNRLYVVGGASGTFNTSSFTSAGTGSFTVPSGVSSVTIRAWGAGGAGGNGSGSSGSGGGGGGGGFAKADISVSGGDTLSINVGSAGTANSGANNGGNGGGYSSVVRSGTTLIQAGGGGGGGGTQGTAAGGQGGGGGGASGTAGTNGGGSATVGGGGGAGTNAGGGAGGTAGTSGVAGQTGAANAGGDGGGSLTSCTTTVTGTGGNGGTGGGGKGGTVASCVTGGGGGGGRFGGGGGGSAINSTNRGAGGGGGGSDLVTGSNTTETAGSAGSAGAGGAPAGTADTYWAGTAGQAGNGATSTTGATAGQPGEVMITYGSFTPQSTVYVSPQLNNGGDITSAWNSTSTSFNVARYSPVVVAYANNLYVLGGYDGTNYLNDTQFTKIISDPGQTDDGTVGSWTYSESLPTPIAGGDGFAANGYVYVVGGKSSATNCDPTTLVAPVSANTTIASGNNPTGIGTWFETNQKYTGARYGNAAVYNDGKAYVYGGACGLTSQTYASPVTQQTAILSQPMVSDYSLMFDANNDVYPTNWLLNGLDNSVGARWQMSYQSMSDPTHVWSGTTGTACSASVMSTWGQTTNYGNVTLGLIPPPVYTAKDGSGTNMNCARYYFMDVSVDSSQAFGYPEDVSRGPTITDMTLAFTSAPAQRLMHGRTFAGELQMPDDTPYYTH